MKLDIIDSISENITKHFEQASEFIKEGIQTGGVLVHCKYGISRSSTLVIAYIMLNKKIPMQQAFNQVRHKRSAIQPNT
jgi:protein-tyrosine phosphatase